MKAVLIAGQARGVSDPQGGERPVPVRPLLGLFVAFQGQDLGQLSEHLRTGRFKFIPTERDSSLVVGETSELVTLFDEAAAEHLGGHVLIEGADAEVTVSRDTDGTYAVTVRSPAEPGQRLRPGEAIPLEGAHAAPTAAGSRSPGVVTPPADDGDDDTADDAES